jgi:hypothetical protein
MPSKAEYQVRDYWIMKIGDGWVVKDREVWMSTLFDDRGRAEDLCDILTHYAVLLGREGL